MTFQPNWRLMPIHTLPSLLTPLKNWTRPKRVLVCAQKRPLAAS
ncbi:hypothetical protein [Azorhizophilus paspali]|uniref:Uncharacterized protein n=1 Tax=Azorhizophilus paspali TaxID=69963 RepID=A0ABV6SUX7_AZOPA